MNKTNSKKLLILGAYQNEADIVRVAKSIGIWTIVTDNRVDWQKVPTKLLADEAWDISWSDLDALENKCRENKVDGVFAGFDEKRIALAKRLCAKLQIPFYAEDVDLDRINDKILFKKACIESGITVPKSYIYGENITFPVIVKPSDQGGSKGISIVYDNESFEDAYQLAKDSSNNGKVLIEEYIVADELMAFFTVINGRVTLSAMCDRYMHYFDNGITQLPIAYVYPSKHLESMLKHNITGLTQLIHNLGVKNGLIAFQAFARDTDIIPFDPTFRIDGTTSYHITEKINNVNVLKMMLSYSLTGKMCDNESLINENPYFCVPAFQFPILLKNGIINRIEGVDSIRNMENVIYVRDIHFVGDEMKKQADFQQMLCRIHFTARSFDELTKTNNFINENLHVYDESGEEMIICRLDNDFIKKLHYLYE